ncbi:MAG: N-acetyl-gamma-glutamyl-phosphate reductase, partial [Lentisphaeria bacterium]|nr:N-acetyl-gamma-glutamyl-phosphate reductase [Lentisphaeria bacterium]
PDQLLSCHSITGFSGGGKKMIAEYEASERPEELKSPRQYGLTQQHKHLKEMVKITGLKHAPIFSPIVADFYSGMEMTLPLFKENLLNGATVADIKALYKSIYNTPVVHYDENASEAGLMAANFYRGTDSMQITVEGNEERILLIARYDNLGKGASGAAVECMNIVMKKDPTCGLELK